MTLRELHRLIIELRDELRILRGGIVRRPAETPGITSLHIMFEVTDVDPYGCDWVTATVTGAPCVGSPVLGDEVTVYDPAGCHFDSSTALFPDNIGLTGFASKMRVNIVDADGYPDGTACRWVVDSLCCEDIV